MNNIERGERLLKEAEEYIEELGRAYVRGSWNIAVRRSQEIVELSLKGLLRIMGVEYPKVHDPGEFFVEVLEQRAVKVDEEIKDRIKRISADLSKRRAPAFYFEEDYTKKEATEAKEGAEFVFQFAKNLENTLRLQ